MSDDIAIEVKSVSKDFVLPHEKISTIKSAFTSLHKRRDTSTEVQHALHDINFEVKKGEFFGIVGRNGSGKSTLLKILAGIYQPTHGKVRTRGKLVPFIELGVGFNPELTGRENVYLNGAMLGFSEKEVDEMYDGIVEFAELERFMDQKLKNYSSGMQVRLAFSLATRAEADILLVDEVLAVGDADFQRKCFDYFRTLKKLKKTVVFVSHDMSSIREYCDRAILIEKSKITASGSSDTIASKYSKLFLEASSKGGEQGESTRWGDGAIKYDTVEMLLNESKERVIITAKATAAKDIDAPNFGFLIRNATGVGVLGTNSHIKRQYIDEVKAGESIALKWEFDNILNDGTFFLEPAILYGGSVTADWWEDAARLEVRKEDATGYVVNPDVKLTVTKDNAR